jgi:hypothetical protein
VKRDDLPIYDLHAYITDPQVLAFNLPHHMTSDIQVITKLYPFVYKVNVKGQTMVAKLGRSVAHDSITDEIKKLYGIQTSAEGPLARVPQLNGLVSSPMGVVGFLTNYIPSLFHSLEYLLTCARITSGAVPKTKTLLHHQQSLSARNERRSGRARFRKRCSRCMLAMSFGAMQSWRTF